MGESDRIKLGGKRTSAVDGTAAGPQTERPAGPDYTNSRLNSSLPGHQTGANDPPALFAIEPMSGIKISLTRVTSETQRAASSSFISLHNAAKDSGLRRGGAALLTCPAAPRRPSGLVVKRPAEEKKTASRENTLARLCPACLPGRGAVTLALCRPAPVKPFNKSHSSVVLYTPNGWHSSSRVVL